jgi:hypothetical protein
MVFPVDHQEETMERDKKVFLVDLKRLIFCIIVGLFFGRGICFCQEFDEFSKLDEIYFDADQSFARAELSNEFVREVLNKHEGSFNVAAGPAESDSTRYLPVPPVSVTLVILISVTAVGWLRRRTPT